jgi:NitT/TauT family transport system permease protein
VTSSSSSREAAGSKYAGRSAEGGGSAREAARASTAFILPALVVAGLIVLWQVAATRIFHWQSFFIPSPVAVAQALGANWDLIMSNAVPTIEEAAGGFVIGSITALVSAVLFVQFKTARHAFYPLAIAIQSIPIVCIAPILVDTLGEGYSSKVVLTAIIAFFPTLVNTVRGLQAVEPSLLDLFQSVHASSWKLLWKLRLPNALPYIFVAFRITATTSVIGAIVAEWIGAPKGLGYLVINFTFEFKTPQLWAAVFVSTMLALGAFMLMALLERIAVPWRAEAGRRP